MYQGQRHTLIVSVEYLFGRAYNRLNEIFGLKRDEILEFSLVTVKSALPLPLNKVFD